MTHLLRLLPVLALLACMPRASAEVLVYRGSFREFDPSGLTRVTTGKCFVIFQRPINGNETAGQAAYVRYFVTPSGPDKGKKVYLTVNPTSYRFGGTERTDGKVFRAISHTEETILEPGFTHASAYFRGLQTTIPLKPGLGGIVLTTQEPAILKGNAQIGGVSFIGVYIERTFSLRQDVQRTLESNAGSLAIAATLNNVVNYIKTLGYQ